MSQSRSHMYAMYVHFAAMILSAMVVMYAVMYMSVWEWGHARWSESRLFMALAMGGTMGLVMLGWMLDMYHNTKLNLLIVVISLLLLTGAIVLDRSQVTVQDSAFMRAMIPHHSMAILRAERAQLADQRVCELAARISEAQRREIMEMAWLIEDIAQNGPVQDADEANSRAVPEFKGGAERQCVRG